MTARGESGFLPAMPARRAAIAFGACVAMVGGGHGSARGDARPFSGRIEAGEEARHQRQGPDATGGLGDWALSNGEICAVVADPSHETDLSDRGGTLVDLGRCGVADDQLVLLQSLANLAQEGVIPVSMVRAESDADAARLETLGRRDGLVLETRYEVDVTTPRRLRVSSRLSRESDGPALRAFGDVVVHGDRGLEPFTLSGAEPERSHGFRHPEVDLGSALSIARATHRADTHVLVGADGLAPGVSYGFRVVSATLERADGSRRAAPFVVLAAQSFSGFAAFPGRFLRGAPGSLGWLEAVQLPFFDLDLGESLLLEREIWVGERSDVASVTDLLFGDAPRVEGRIDDATAAIHVDARDGSPRTMVRPDTDGRFAFRLPPGAHVLRAIAPDGRTVEQVFEIGAGGTELAPIALGAGARVELPRSGPMRLVFLGEGGTPDPDLHAGTTGARFGERPAERSLEGRDVVLGGTPSDPTHVTLPPGRYRVLATRGPEFDVTEARITVEPGAPARLEIAPPPRAVETPGWIAADLHVHAAPSDDSSFPLERRVASFVAEGAEVLVATDHDHVTDYGPLVRELGLASRIASVVGQELTSNTRSPAAPETFGHLNAFPLPYRPERYRKGAIPNEGRRLRDALAAVQALGGERVVQLNHARGPDDRKSRQDFFTHLGARGAAYDPSRRLDEPPNSALLEVDPTTGLRDLDFDAIELLNGPSMPRYERLRADWFSLLRQGVVKTATANGDSHRMSEIAATPRTYVRVSGDSPARFDEAAFIAALLGGHAYGTTGPILHVDLGGAAPGDVFAGDAATLRVRVDVAPWVPLSGVRIHVGSERVEERAIAPAATLELPLRFAHDGFVVVEAFGSADARYAEILPGFTPFAFSNAIRVDADGDGTWRPPGALDTRAAAPGSAELPTPAR